MNPPQPSPKRTFSSAGPLATIVTLSLMAGQSAQAELIHRWSFNNPAGSADGAVIPDTIGGEAFPAEVRGSGATFTGTAIRLPGGGSGTAPYVDLPNDLIGSGSPLVLENKNTVTIEGWVTLKGTTGAWARYFDFGSGQAGEVLTPGGGFNGTNYLFYSAATGGNYATQQLEIRVAEGDGQNTVWRPDKPAAVDQQIYFAVTVDSSDGLQSFVSLWRNDERLVNNLTSQFLLNQIFDINNWLGRSNWAGDANLNAEFDEFRIYDHVLSPEEIFASRASGANNLVVDTDSDGMPDGWELLNGLNVGINDSAGDADSDGLTNVQEFQRGTNPQNPDTDGDGLSDSQENNSRVFQSATNPGTDPLNPDTDRDGLPDSVENKTGVFVSATNTGTDPHNRDTDGDGSGDATEVASASDPNLPSSLPVPRLDHRYSFNETSGRKIVDPVGGAHAWVLGSGFTLSDGQLNLAGGNPNTAAYVALPAGVISNYGLAKGGRGAVTMEGWATVDSTGGGVWARLVDFGTSEPGGEAGALYGPGNWNGGGTAGLDTFFITAYNDLNLSQRLVALRKTDTGSFPATEFTLSPLAFPETQVHFAVTFDESSGQLRYYEDGVASSSTESNPDNPVKLAVLRDFNNWLGRSNYTNDGNLHGKYNEFRIYDGVLPESVIAQHTTAGPDAAPQPAAGAADTDGDGMPDWFERAHGLNPAVNDAAGDLDTDGVTNLQEYQRGSLPTIADTDRDGLSDAVETNTGTFVSASDTGSNPAAYDSDGDFSGDHPEVLINSNPNDGTETKAVIKNRWSFNNPAGEAPDGTTVTDSIGNNESAMVRGDGGLFTGTALSIPGGSSAGAAYVDLPNGLISPLRSLTVETWYTLQNSGNAWARVFDFGNTLESPGVAKEVTGPGDFGEGGDYFFVSATVGDNYNLNRIEIRNAAPAPVVGALYDPAVTYEEGALVHLVAMVDSTTTGTSRLNLWRNGVPLVVNAPSPVNLANIDDVNNWIGRSNWINDANLAGTFDEFRIYEGLLSPERIAQNITAGPDGPVDPVDPPASDFQIASITAAPGQPVSISFQTEAGLTYQIETSTALSGWTALGAAVPGTGALVTVQDTVNNPAAGRRFYRVRRN